MIRGTTPTHTFTLPFDTNLVKCVKVIYAQNDRVILTKKTDDCILSENKVKVKLTQEDTFAFDCKYTVQIQIRALALDGDSLISDIYTVSVGKCLDDEVLT